MDEWMRGLCNTTQSHFSILTVEHMICSSLLWMTVQMHSTRQHVIHQHARKENMIEVVKTF